MGIKSSFAQTNFTAGELSPRAFGRFDLAKFTNGVKRLENWLIYQLGGALFRPGTRYVNEVKDSTKPVRIVKFQYSTIQNYVIEVGDLYMRFFANSGRVENPPGTPVELVTTYAVADIFRLHFAQNADVMYITHGNYPPRKLTRTSAVTFNIANVNFIRGPFLDSNITKVTLTPSADAGSAITLTAATVAWVAGTSYVTGPINADYVTNGGNTYRALSNHVSSAVFANDLAAGLWVLVAAGNVPTIFQAGHVGSLWRVKGGVVKITGFTSAQVVTGDVQAEPNGTAGALATGPAATADWSEGAFSAVRGFPATVSFHEQRLWYASTTFEPQKEWGAYVVAPDNFKTDAADDSAAVAFQIASEEVNAIRWLSSGPKAMQNGTSEGTFATSSGTLGAPITAKNINVEKNTDYGVAQIRPKRISSYLYYITRSLYQLRELFYNYLVDTQVSNDMTLLADHVLRDGAGAVDMDHQQSPNDRMWLVRADGQIAVLTRNPEEQVMGWSRLVAGRTAKGDGLFESVAVIPREGGDDQVWTVVKRNINGTNKRFIEFFTDEDFLDAWDPVRLDASLSYDVPVVITGATSANPVVITAVAHGFANGDQVKIDVIKGKDTDTTRNPFGLLAGHNLNGNRYIVTNKTADTFELYDEYGATIDGTAFSTYISGGEVRKMVTAISGLDHLNGETVSVMVDGGVPASQQTYLVAAGAITLAQKAAVVHVGLPYTGTMQMLKLSDGSQTTGQTKLRRVYLSTIRVYRSLGLAIGKTLDAMRPFYFREVNNPLGHAPELVTGDVEKFFSDGWGKEDEIIIQQTDPLPLFILAIVLRSEVEEK